MNLKTNICLHNIKNNFLKIIEKTFSERQKQNTCSFKFITNHGDRFASTTRRTDFCSSHLLQ